MHFLITGGAGFIGSHLARRLIADGHSVVVADNLSTGLRENVPAAARLLEGDVGSPDFVSSLPAEKFDVVCHLAAQSSGPASADMPYYDLQANAASTLLLSRWCLTRGVTRFVYASSMAIYGNPDQTPTAEDTPCMPRSYYGISKLASEHMLRLAAQEGLQATSLRMFSIYGPGQNLGNLKQGMASIFMAYMLKGQEVPVTGSLDRFRDFVYIDDVIDAWVRISAMKSTPVAAYNIGRGQRVTVQFLLAELKRALGLPADYPVRELPGSAFDQFGLCADTRLAREQLGWEARTPLEAGLARMAAWARGTGC